MAGLEDALTAARGGRRDLTDDELWGWQEALEDARDERLALSARLDRAEATLTAVRTWAQNEARAEAEAENNGYASAQWDVLVLLDGPASG